MPKTNEREWEKNLKDNYLKGGLITCGFEEMARFIRQVELDTIAGCAKVARSKKIVYPHGNKLSHTEMYINETCEDIATDIIKLKNNHHADPRKYN